MFFLVITIVLLSLATKAQSTTDTTKYYYCELIGMQKAMGLSRKITAAVEFGGEKLFTSDTTYTRVLPMGMKTHTFDNLLVPLNFMAGKGWKLVQYYTYEIEGLKIHNYILEKPR